METTATTATVHIEPYGGEHQLPAVSRLVERTLSEPYSVYTYRYFLRNWPELAFVARCPGSTLLSRSNSNSSSSDDDDSKDDGSDIVGVVLGRREPHLSGHARREADNDGTSFSIPFPSFNDVFGSSNQSQTTSISPLRGYIAMLVVAPGQRRTGLGRTLVEHILNAMRIHGCSEAVLETECSNTAALALYEKLGFLRDKRLAMYYHTGTDAFRLKMKLVQSQDNNKNQNINVENSSQLQVT